MLSQRVENHIDKKMEHEMKAGMRWGLICADKRSVGNP